MQLGPLWWTRSYRDPRLRLVVVLMGSLARAKLRPPLSLRRAWTGLPLQVEPRQSSVTPPLLSELLPRLSRRPMTIDVLL